MNEITLKLHTLGKFRIGILLLSHWFHRGPVDFLVFREGAISTPAKKKLIVIHISTFIISTRSVGALFGAAGSGVASSGFVAGIVALGAAAVVVADVEATVVVDVVVVSVVANSAGG